MKTFIRVAEELPSATTQPQPRLSSAEEQEPRMDERVNQRELSERAGCWWETDWFKQWEDMARAQR